MTLKTKTKTYIINRDFDTVQKLISLAVKDKSPFVTFPYIVF